MRKTTLALAAVLTLAVATCNGEDPEADGDGDIDSDGDVDGDSDVDADAGPVTCDELGATRTVACERCGSASQTCGPDGLWEEAGHCFDQGDCEAGEVETDEAPSCGPRQRLCREDCTWSAWEPEPECEPGQTRTVADGCELDWDRTDTCAEDCTWEEGSCTADSPCGVRRMSPELSEEICVPAGTFIRGDREVSDARPVAEVTMSAYFIDRFPVTNERYRACYEAAVCPALNPSGADAFRDPTWDRRPVTWVTREAAQAFCAWDGGRRLPTEAEWEMAARGPAPRRQAYVWGDEPVRCDLLTTEECPGYTPPEWDVFSHDVDAWPGTASYYGTELMVGGGWEHTLDVYDPYYYSSPESFVDPTGPPCSRACSYTDRGWCLDDGPSSRRLAKRGQAGGLDPCRYCFVRCARDAEL